MTKNAKDGTEAEVRPRGGMKAGNSAPQRKPAAKALGLLVQAPIQFPEFKALRKVCSGPSGLPPTPRLRDNIARWIQIGLKLEEIARNEMDAQRRSRGRQKGWTPYPNDQKIVDAINFVMEETGLSPKVVVPAVVERLENDNLVHAQPRTHLRRITRKLKIRNSLLAKALKLGDNK